MGRTASLFVAVGMVLALMVGTVQAQSASLRMTTRPDRVTP
jgi:hypothetical protein